MKALGAGSVEAVIAEIGALPEGRYNGFNLLCAGPDGAGLVAYGNGSSARRLSRSAAVNWTVAMSTALRFCSLSCLDWMR